MKGGTSVKLNELRVNLGKRQVHSGDATRTGGEIGQEMALSIRLPNKNEELDMCAPLSISRSRHIFDQPTNHRQSNRKLILSRFSAEAGNRKF